MQERMANKIQVSPRIIHEQKRDNRVYQLIQFSLPDIGPKRRSSLIADLLNKPRSIGIMEWWERGSIINKPKRDFMAILVTKKD